MSRKSERTSRGSFLLLFGLLIPALLGFGALSIDLSYLRNSRMELRNAVDASAHAAMMEYRRSGSERLGRSVAMQVAASNHVAGHTLTLQDADIDFGSWDFDTSQFTTGGSFINAARVTATRDQDATDGPTSCLLAPAIGIQAGEAAA